MRLVLIRMSAARTILAVCEVYAGNSAPAPPDFGPPGEQWNNEAISAQLSAISHQQEKNACLAKSTPLRGIPKSGDYVFERHLRPRSRGILDLRPTQEERLSLRGKMGSVDC